MHTMSRIVGWIWFFFTTETLLIVDSVSFRALDCSKPKDVRRIGLAYDQCHIPEMAEADVREVVVQIAKHDDQQVVKGWKCEAQISRKFHRCNGTIKHLVPLTTQPVISPHRVFLWECYHMMLFRWYEVMGRRNISIQMNGTTSATFDEVGYTWPTDYPGKYHSCRGEEYIWNGTSYDDLVIISTVHLSLSSELYRGNGDKVVAVNSGVPLSIGFNIPGGEMSPNITHMWWPHHAFCKLGAAKLVNGYLTSGVHFSTVFVSTDGSNIRLELDGTKSVCNRTFHLTSSKDHLLLMWNSKNGQILPLDSDPLPLPEMINSVPLTRIHFIQSADHVIKESSHLIRTEANFVYQQNCLRRLQQAKFLIGTMLMQPKLVSWIIDGDTVASSSGEVITTFDCTPVEVIAAPNSRCYEGLRVQHFQLRPDPYTKAPPITFMEPITRRLSAHSQEIPCDFDNPLVFKGIDHRWYAATPVLIQVASPSTDLALLGIRHQLSHTTQFNTTSPKVSSSFDFHKVLPPSSSQWLSSFNLALNSNKFIHNNNYSYNDTLKIIQTGIDFFYKRKERRGQNNYSGGTN